MRALDIGTDRVAEVLQEMGVLHDDRRPAFEDWLQRKLDGLAFGIRGDVESWLRTMRDGGPRSRPRDLASVQNYMNHVRPVLLEWSARYDHLREVTRDDILAVLAVLHGSHRNNVLVGLRRLFTFCRKTRVIFRDPTRGIKVGEHPSGIVLPLDQSRSTRPSTAATTPVARLVLVLAAVHAARKGAIIGCGSTTSTSGNRRLTIAGRRPPAGRPHPTDPAGLARPPPHPMADHRQPHLIINQHTAMGTGPVTTRGHRSATLRGQAATLERLRVDRQLEEALTLGPDPLHLAAVFGLDPKTAIRYAENARTLLVTTAEEHNPPAATE